MGAEQAAPYLLLRAEMFKLSEEQKQKKMIHALLSNGYRFAVMAGGLMAGKYRYRYEAERGKKHGSLIIELRELL